MLRFVLGAVAGGIAMWLWGEGLRRRMDEGTRAARLTAVDTLKGMEDRADQVLDAAREQVHATLHAGEEMLQPKIS